MGAHQLPSKHVEWIPSGGLVNACQSQRARRDEQRAREQSKARGKRLRVSMALCTELDRDSRLWIETGVSVYQGVFPSLYGSVW